MTSRNPNLDLVNINAHTKFCKFKLHVYPFSLKILSRNEILTEIKGQTSATKLCKMIGNNPNLDLVNINEQTKFGQILSICSQDIERKRNSERNSDIHQGPQLCYNCAKNDCNNPNLDLVNINSFIVLHYL